MLNLHDYCITGLQLDAGSHAVILSLTDPSGSQASKLRLPGVISLFVDGFSLQNVVLDTKIFSKVENSFEYRRACELLDLDRTDDKVLDGSKALIFIEASVGAELACLMSDQPDLALSPF